jgi:hypothetical protein
MKVIRIIPEHIKQREVVDNIKCDICNEKIVDRTGWSLNEIKINALIGDVYPECDTRTGYIIDCCEGCFLDKIKPLIEKTFNIKFREVDSDEKGHEDFF